MIVIPMVGRSSRFFDAGYVLPKFQLKIDNLSVFSHAVRSFERYFYSDEFIFMIRSDYSTPAFVEHEVRKLGIRNYSIKIFDYETRGQAETVFLGLREVGGDTPIYIFNIDTFRPGFTKPRHLSECDGYLEVFEGEGEMWSFVQPGNGTSVVRTTEKDRISNLCSDGLYYFRKKRLFDEAFIDSLNRENTAKGEYYIAPLYNKLIQDGLDVQYHLIKSEEVIFCGTPKEYECLKEY